MQPEQPVDQPSEQPLVEPQEQTAVLSRSPFGTVSFSRRQLSYFALIFAIVGGFIIWRSFAAGTISWRGDYETGNFSQWGCGIQEKTSGRATIVNSPLRQGQHAARFEVDPGDNNVAGSGTGERAEICSTQAQADGYDGHEVWYAWSTLFPTGFQAPSDGNWWSYFTQWHHTGPTGQAPAMNVLGNGTINMRMAGGSNPSSPVYTNALVLSGWQHDVWYDFAVHIKWSSDPSIGFYEVFVNGKRATSIMHGPTLYTGQGIYMKQGYYREAQNYTDVIYEDGVRVGNSYDAVVADFPAGTWPLTPGGSVSSAPTVSLSASPTVVTAGSTSKLSWNSTNATSCAASGGWSGSQPTSGSFTTAALNTNTTFSLTCTGAGGSVTATAAVSISAAAPASSVTATSTINDGATLSGTIPWVVSTSQPVHTVDYYMNNIKVGSVTKDGTSFSYNLDTTLYPNVTHGGFQVYDSSGALVYRSPSISFTISNSTTPPAVSTNAWTGQYYDNQDLTNLKITRVDPAINFNWASGTSPDATIAPTTYSSTWKGSFSFDAANYNFSVTADDGVRVYIDGALRLDKWLDTYPATYTFTASVSAGAHIIQVNYYNNQGGGTANISWAKQVALPVGTGLTGTYFDNSDLTNQKLSRLDSSLNFNWGSGSPSSVITADTFSARWSGRLLAKTTEAYTLTTQSDDGIRVWLNGNLIINNWTNHAATYNSATVNLSQGQFYTIKVEYYDNTGSAVAKLLWSTPTIAQQVIPTANLFPS